MVYITGDMHGDPRNLVRFSEAHSLTSEDTIIILGDAGFNCYLHGCYRKAKILAEEGTVAYLNVALEDGDISVITVVLGDVARAERMTQLSRATYATRKGRYKALSSTGNPSFETMQKAV